jgi:PTS system glucose-specific IIA component
MSDAVVLAPVAGRVIPLAEVPDMVFASAMVGPGAAIDPDADALSVEALSPVPGVVAALHPHAFVIAGPGGGNRGVLVHLGIDTVQLQGLGFELLAAQGDEVAAGQALVRWSPAAVVAQGKSAIVAVIALAAAAEELELVDVERVAAGDELFTWRPA